jgi:hypothetical protein
MRERSVTFIRVLSAAAGLAAVLANPACGPVASFTPRGEPSEGRAPDCEIVVIHQRPESDYSVIGVLDVAAFSVRRIPRDDAAFLELVRPAACRAGADAVIPGVTGDGRYIQATVVKWIAPDEDAPVCPPREAPPKEREEPVVACASGVTTC